MDGLVCKNTHQTQDRYSYTLNQDRLHQHVAIFSFGIIIINFLVANCIKYNKCKRAYFHHFRSQWRYKVLTHPYSINPTKERKIQSHWVNKECGYTCIVSGELNCLRISGFCIISLNWGFMSSIERSWGLRFKIYNRNVISWNIKQKRIFNQWPGP